MAQKKPVFRFRLPWLQFGSAPRPTPRSASQLARTAASTPFLSAISESKPGNIPPVASRGSSSTSQTQTATAFTLLGFLPVEILQNPYLLSLEGSEKRTVLKW
nr:mucin-17-like isoform X1 [Ipomoea batatas]GME08475.1 mucin-17-like isoform X1 [Ipomoea batatas]GME08478.1 mucin-17-like isoform X1 [Ipomoea batatas]